MGTFKKRRSEWKQKTFNWCLLLQLVFGFSPSGINMYVEWSEQFKQGVSEPKWKKALSLKQKKENILCFYLHIEIWSLTITRFPYDYHIMIALSYINIISHSYIFIQNSETWQWQGIQQGCQAPQLERESHRGGSSAPQPSRKYTNFKQNGLKRDEFPGSKYYCLGTPSPAGSVCSRKKIFTSLKSQVLSNSCPQSVQDFTLSCPLAKRDWQMFIFWWNIFYKLFKDIYTIIPVRY